jgi:serine/threonine protein phosphatase PrpC
LSTEGARENCPGCGERIFTGDGYCEACGYSLRDVAGPATAAAGCVGCGGSAISEDGYCDACGLLQPADRDHVETVLPAAGSYTAAAVSDRGLRRSRNEDAVALAAAGDAVVAVVSDGVSTAPRPDQAAQLAVETAVAVLTEQIESGADAAAATGTAMAAAAKAVAGLATGEHDAPACTYVSAVVAPERVTVGWIGDSRVYWAAGSQAAHPSARLTRDDTLADGHSHVITAWLGADADAVEPHIETFHPGGPGAVIVCSDGLWNHLPEPAQMTAALLSGPSLAAARALVRVALDGGGQDNITVALLPYPPEVNIPKAGPRKEGRDE